MPAKHIPRFTGFWLTWAVSAIALPISAQSIGAFPHASPESLGFSSQRMQRLDATFQRLVAEKQVAGMVVIGARHGKVFYSRTYGLRDIETGTPMSSSDLFRICSMTKPIIGVAMMMLYEEGKWNPQDPIEKYIPEFAHLKVLKEIDPLGKPILEDPAHPPTMRELMTHTAGFSYGIEGSPVDRLYQDDKGWNRVLGAPSLQEMIDRLAQLPLAYQPGAHWRYSISVDVQGYLVQKLSGQPLPAFLKERLFDPLGMEDTRFYVPKDKAGRLATVYKRNEQGQLEADATDPLLRYFRYDSEPTLPSGGGGLVSTAADYLRFAQMLLNGGVLNGKRFLGPETVRMLRANHTPEPLMTSAGSDGSLRPGLGFGYDFAVVTNPGLADNPTGENTYYWGGYAGTWFWIDPTNDIVFVGMVQHVGDPNTWALRELTQQTLYQALLDPRK